MGDFITDRLSPILLIILVIGLNVWAWSNFASYMWILYFMLTIASIFAVLLSIELWRDY